MRLQDLVPPLLWKATAGIRSRVYRPAQAGGRSFSSYADAAKNCEGFGYETDELVELIFRKTENYRALCLRTGVPSIGQSEALLLLALGLGAGHKRETLRVVDFGGAGGAHYFLARSVFHKDLQLDWRVVETPAMVARVKALISNELRFFSSLEAACGGPDTAGAVDVIHASGALQYTPNPPAVLESLLGLRSHVIVLTRLALTTGSSVRIEVQESRLADNGPGPTPPDLRIGDKSARYPITFLPQSAFEAQLTPTYALTANVADASVHGGGQEGLTGRAYIGCLK